MNTGQERINEFVIREKRGRLGMRSEWTKKKLSDIVDFNPRETIKKGTIAKKIPMDVLRPFYRDIPYYVEACFSSGMKFRNGDTIMARITPCLENGKTAQVSILNDGEVGFGSTEYIVFRAKEGIAKKDYLYYLVCSPEVREPAIKSMVGSSGRQRVQTDVVKNLEIDVPPLVEQEKIGSLLKLFDDKIALNDKLNNNLEQQVTTAFYNMFGKYEQISNTHKPLSTIAKFKYGTMPKKDKLGTGHYHAFSGYQIVGTYPEVMFENPQLIIVARGVGGCGDVKYTPANCYLTNLSIAIITEKTMHDDYLYHYLRLHDTKIMNTGSAQPQITVATLEKIEIPIPPEEEMIRFSDFVQPFKQQYRNNQDENKLLSKLRDTLLSKLMSGELDISDIDI